ncbi:IclR family transcriptional regulator [uncultured Microbacterium sp.]|uniref:IclR family transcriptional regulator n=1 Tax=uncultured Microbacterium sp. TaxID=191216 RepID=UPI00261CFADA|nr:IclR family transcriptional regulator [uncultured Microbacterium sp.]
MAKAHAETSTSFERGLAVMIQIALAGETSVESVAADLEIPVSTVYRYIRSLRELDLVEVRNGNYFPGWRLIELSGQYLSHARLAEIGGSILESIVDATSETAVLTVRSGIHAICLRQAVSPHPLRYAFKVNQLLPLHAGAGQRALLAFAPESVIDNVLEHSMPRYTHNTLTRPDLLRHLDQIRQSGYAISRGELNQGAVAVALPVFSKGEIICSLAVAGPETRCSSAAWRQQAITALRAGVKLLSEAV